MSNVANQPFADLLAKTFPPVQGASKVFTAGETAQKMLAFWSLKQSTKSFVLRVGSAFAKFTLHACPKCGQHLSAQATRMNDKERAIFQAALAIVQAQMAPQAASTGKGKQAKQAKPAVVPVQAPASEPFEPNSADDMTLEQLEALTAPGGERS